MKKNWLSIAFVSTLMIVGNSLPIYAETLAPNKNEKIESVAKIDSNKSADVLSETLFSTIMESSVVKTLKNDVAKKEAEAKKAAEEKAKKIAAEKAQQEEQAKQQADMASSQLAANNGGGQVLYMESTAYSYAEGAIGGGTVTALGQNLASNPMAVAVDSSVIPLGTRLYVEGYGEAIASDTGGAIKGNIIDVHFADPSACNAWGRRLVKVTILG